MSLSNRYNYVTYHSSWNIYDKSNQARKQRKKLSIHEYQAIGQCFQTKHHYYVALKFNVTLCLKYFTHRVKYSLTEIIQVPLKTWKTGEARKYLAFRAMLWIEFAIPRKFGWNPTLSVSHYPLSRIKMRYCGAIYWETENII